MPNIFLHIINDRKFLKSPVEQFGEIEEIYNYYYLLDFNVKAEVIQKPNYTIHVFNSYHRLFQSINNLDFDVLIMHSYFLSPFLLFKYRNKKIIWISWGYDIYIDQSLGFIKPGKIKLSLFKHKTRMWWMRNKFLGELIKGILSWPSTMFNYLYLQKYIRSVSCVLDNEYLLLNARCKYALEQFPFRYINNNSSVINKLVGTNILLGNSSDPSNNQLDLIDLLAGLNISNEILSPLSYGNKKHRDEVIKYGRFKLPNKFVPIVDFLSIEEYKKKISECSYLIMGHIRQQAMGNIYMGLQMGMKVFLYEDSVAYKYLKQRGFIIHTIENLSREALSVPLTIEEKEHNMFVYEEVLNRREYSDKFRKAVLNLIIESI